MNIPLFCTNIRNVANLHLVNYDGPEQDIVSSVTEFKKVTLAIAKELLIKANSGDFDQLKEIAECAICYYVSTVVAERIKAQEPSDLGDDIHWAIHWFEHAVCKLLKTLFVKWEHYSGDIDYPVPIPTKAEMWSYNTTAKKYESPGDFYWVIESGNCFSGDKKMTMWNGPYGKSRIQLLEFIIQELEHQIRKEQNATKFSREDHWSLS
ncbi:hypothetical protein KNT64_gp194 [Pseudomonas phage PspYZU05]|uniref:Uncharacterized protein n=1 Tax=Pseudomonas phage PspYZU05 TaxID=1983556 RepID=A0A2U7N574_9CAUD|nr:hypothetical protein KNT64_gp194 [Pseudomonas phage PspYZU05]ASD52146.1 hypothetical protein PspYZU05_194 [Pseudomonas phage PspYZU05]